MCCLDCLAVNSLPHQPVCHHVLFGLSRSTVCLISLSVIMCCLDCLGQQSASSACLSSCAVWTVLLSTVCLISLSVIMCCLDCLAVNSLPHQPVGHHVLFGLSCCQQSASSACRSSCAHTQKLYAFFACVWVFFSFFLFLLFNPTPQHQNIKMWKIWHMQERLWPKVRKQEKINTNTVNNNVNLYPYPYLSWHSDVHKIRKCNVHTHIHTCTCMYVYLHV